MKTGVVIAISVGILVALLLGAWRVQRAIGGDVVGEPGNANPSTQPSAGALSFTVKDIDGNDVNLDNFRGKVVMIVNVASKCGFTKQYAGLERLYDNYKDQGFVIVGFPANNFGGQEPGSNEQIKEFCTSTYQVSFPMMSKISVAGDDRHPLYAYLTDQTGEFSGKIGWNFTKFLVGRDGQVYARFGSKADPQDPSVIAAIEKGLNAQ
jgi:glutathione peroxidase-family protein